MNTLIRFYTPRRTMRGRPFLRQQSMAIRILTIIFVTASMLIPAVAKADCGPVPGGPPNSCPGVASTGGNGGPDSGVGNPINVMTGNKYEREVDMPALPGVLGLEIVRHYNSEYSRPVQKNGSMGRGWRMSYETELYDFYGRIQILQGDGGRVIFDRDPKNPNLCSTPNPANGSMSIVLQANGPIEYVWTWTNGRKLYFNKSGKLYRIKAPTGEFVSLEYDKRNALRRVTDPQGRSLDLVYFDPKMENHFRGVQYIDSPVGRFEYQYGSELPKGSGVFDARYLLALMTKVTLPTGFDPDKPGHALADRGTTASEISHVYHHEDPKSPWVMTGISFETRDADGKRVATRHSTYGYDGDARAILSTHANNVDKVTLDTSVGGKTVLTNSLGQKTTYLHGIVAGEHRLLEVRGAGCALCGEVNVRYGYNPAGQLTQTTKLSLAGEPVSATRTEFDKLGRAVRIGSVAYAKGKPQPVQWMTRFEYQGSSFAPSLVARPSVVPGRQAFTRIAYNPVGQPLSVTESGWIPTLDGARVAGEIERTTRYKYATINDRSLLIEIDGPLPNGKTNSPLDSDITVIEYDSRANNWVPPKAKAGAGGLEEYEPTLRREGLLTRIIAPGNFITEVLARDKAKRPMKLRTIDGDQIQVATVASDWRGAPHDIDLVAGALRRHLHYDYNAAGQLAAVTLPGGLRTQLQYNAAGQLGKTTLPDGSGLLNQQDTEGHTARSARFLDAAADGGKTLPDISFAYEHPMDAPSKLTSVGDALGELRNYRYDDVGQIVAVTNALGIASKFAYDAAGRLSSRTDAAGSPDAATTAMAFDSTGRATNITAANSVTTVRRYDDFGRKVMEADPDHGATLFRYDAAGHLVARIDETMVTTRFTFDHAGRLLAVGADEQPNLLQYRYKGRQLAGVVSTTDENPRRTTERIDYQRDALGRVVKETRWLANANRERAAGGTFLGTSSGTSPGIVFVTTSDYDDAGRLAGQTLPDGHALKYRYAPAGDGDAPRAMHRPGQLEAILFDGAAVVTDIEQTIAGGLTGYTMSNGMRQRISLDGRGRIEHLQVSADSANSANSWWSRIKAWFGASAATAPAPYRQDNRYDAAGRLVQIDRQTGPIQPGGKPVKRGDGYAYDRLDRLASIVGSDGTGTTYRYDKGGNRVGEVARHTGTPENGLTERAYHYAQDGNRLLAVTYGESAQGAALRPLGTAPASSGDVAQAMRGAWFYHATGVQLAQMQWLNQGGTANRRIVYNVAKRPIAIYDNDQLVARYHYNSRGERIAKTVYPVRPALRTVANSLAAQQGETTYSLYRDQRLAYEADGAGRVTAHYIYLYGKPVAKIEMEADNSIIHRFWRAVTSRGDKIAMDTFAHVYAIVTDHLGTPQQVMDEHREVVWQAETTPFGQARIIFAAITGAGANAKPFVMNLRLPGQVFDAETRLNYNYLRDYDPEVGRYTAPDPVGLGGGTNPYSYVSNNPLTNTDPFGLYQIDVHYYMTFFLAITAGVNEATARQIALATQYIDDNPDTSPTPAGYTIESMKKNPDALDRYHFVEADSDDLKRTPLQQAYKFIFGQDSDTYIADRIKNPSSPQLARLLAASTTAKTDPNANCGSSAQLFGEYLHAFEDTFAHRNKANDPYTAESFGYGTGHALAGENPDYTYNHWSGIPGLGYWGTNQDRTLEMEKEVQAKLMSSFGYGGKTKSFLTIKSILEEFNKTPASEKNIRSGELQEKISILNNGLITLGYSGIDLVVGSIIHGYDAELAQKNRKKALGNLNPADYVGTILPNGTAPLPEIK